MYNLTLPPQLRRKQDPTASRRRFPLTLVIPPDKARLPGLALPAGWQRLADGGIEVTFQDAYTLQVCLDATQAIRKAIVKGD